MSNEQTPNRGPLSDLRLIEMGTLLAGPFCGQLMGDFGAEVIKVEPPNQGDPMRDWGQEKAHGMSLWWPVIARNKKSVTLNLREAEGQEIARDLIAKADFLLENFRPGTMERWNLSYEELKKINPGSDHDSGLGLWPDRPLFQARRLRRGRRSHGRPALRLRRSLDTAEPDGYQHRRFTGGNLCLPGRANRPAPSRTHRRGPGC